MEMSESEAAVDPAVEAKAIAAVVEALKGLDAAAVSRVLDWASKRYGARAPVDRARRQEPGGGGPAGAPPPPADGDYADLAALYNAAKPTSDAERVLVAAYWHQVKEQKDNFDSQALNADLKNLGHRVGNVTRACSALMREQPALMIQVKKSGSTRQARKLYRLTSAGLDRVGEMLARSGGG